MKVLIAGGAGFIGSNLSAFHLQKEDQVTVIDNLITGNTANIDSLRSHPKFNYIEGDITSYDFSKFSQFDIIYNLASPASPIQYKKYPIETLLTNAVGTQKLLEFMHQSKSGSYVISSTSEVYGDPLVHPQVEEYWGNVNPVGPRSCYDEGKRFAEAMTMSYFRKHNLNVRIARIFNTYGPNMERNDGRVVSNFITQALANEPITIYGNGKQTRSFCFVSDMVQGLYKLATVPDIAGSIINIGNPDERNMIELAELVKKMTPTKSEIVFKEIDADDPKMRKPNIDKARQILGWEPKVKLEDGLKDAITYFKERFFK